MDRNDGYNLLQAVRDEYNAAKFSVTITIRGVESAHTFFCAPGTGIGISPRELHQCARNLEVTYVLRLYTEFERIMRDFWVHARHRKTKPGMEILINRVAAIRNISDPHRDLAHEVRDYRNKIVHEGQRAAILTFTDCLSRLGRFMSWLPIQW
jgi:hypothetical protein